DFIEILRFFHEGLFGRYMEERQLAGNVLNVHEGVQLLGSTFAALLIIAGLFHPRDRWQSVGSFLVAAVLGAIAIYLVPRYGSALSRIFGRWISLAAAAVLVNAAVIAVFAAKRHINRTLGRLSAAYGLMLRRPRDLDTGFHLIWMGGILAAVTIPEVQHIVYRLYGGLDFTHSRLSIVAVLSASALAAIFLNELLPTQSASDTQPARIAHLAAILIASLFVAWMIKGTALDSFDWTAAIKIGTWSPLNRPIPAELVKTLVAGGIFVALMVLAFASRHQKQTVQAAVFALGCIMAFEAVAYARFKYSGPHTHTYPIPFRANNYFNAPPCTLIPPSATAVRALRQRLEADEYRSVLLADLVRFPAFTEPHIAQFWDLRLLGGYGAGVPSRLTSLPWPKELHRVRNIRFFSLDTTSLKLLALLNVKYIVFVDDALYFNRDSTAAGTTSRSPCTHHDMAPGQVSEVENPYKPIPRQFFARQIVPATFGDAAISPDDHPQDTSIVEGIDRAR
ncbi:MAG TPA: hypothetical protein VG897_17585, partial [Terriglobales bacterium]|nr:hypothetical protein [Terriglobales bacterium]